MGYTFEALAIHGIRGGKRFDVGQLDVGKLDPAVRDHLADYLDELDELSELDGKAAPGWWKTNGKPPAELDTLATCPLGGFAAAADSAMARLVLASPGNASDGLLMFVRAHANGGTAAFACLKLKFTAIEDLWYTGKANPQDAIDQLRFNDVLPKPKEVRKAAVSPNPSGTGDLRVVDNQLQDPADYWLDFLGAAARPTEKKMTKTAAAALTVALSKAAQMPPHAAAGLVSTELDKISAGGQAVKPATVTNNLAAVKNIDPGALWAAAKTESAELGNPHYELTPDGADEVFSTYDLGDRITLKGPSRLLDPKVDFKPDGQGGHLLTIPVPGPVTPTRD